MLPALNQWLGNALMMTKGSEGAQMHRCRCSPLAYEVRCGRQMRRVCWAGVGASPSAALGPYEALTHPH